MPNYNPDMTAADQTAENLLLVVPTGDAKSPLMVELGRWNADAGRWEGEWRFTVTDTGAPTPLADMDPVAWATVPEIDASLLEGLAA